MEVTLNLPENIYRNFQKLAERTSRRIDEVIAEKIQNDHWVENLIAEESITNFPSAEVLEMANLKLSEQQDKRMSQLPENQLESHITTSGKLS